MLTWRQQSLRDKPEYPPLFHYPNTKPDSSLQTRPVNTQKWENLTRLSLWRTPPVRAIQMARRRKESEEREENWRGNKAKKLGREGEGRNKEKWTKVHFYFSSFLQLFWKFYYSFFLYQNFLNSVRRSQESITEHHNDMEKSHWHLLSTHLINIRYYKTSFVGRPRQLVAIYCKEV